MFDPSRNLTSSEKQEYETYVEEKYRRDSLMMFNNLLIDCFTKCVDKFQSKNLGEKEKECMKNCTERQMKTTQRVGFRYTELNFWDKFNN